MTERTVLALGGNALLKPEQTGTFQQQLDNARKSIQAIDGLLRNGQEVVLTHGNGPQVGNILNENRSTEEATPPMPLFACGAQSQGLIGFMLQIAFEQEFHGRDSDRSCVPIVTPVAVDGDSDAFENPTKPVGPFYSEEEAKTMIENEGASMIEDAGRGWRRVVPSPEPGEIYGVDTVHSILENQNIPVVAGGGGIPITVTGDDGPTGANAVVDKDLTGATLADQIDAQTYVILTDVSHVALNYGEPDQVDLEKISVDEARKYQDKHFERGSMYEKIEAACHFVEGHSDRRAVITSLQNATEAVTEDVGTTIYDDQP